MKNIEKDASKSVSEAAEAKNKKGLSRRVKYGSMSAVTIVIVMAILIVVNLMASIMERRTPMKIDLTPDKRYDLSDETINVLKELDQDVEITVTMTKSSFTDLKTYYSYMLQSYGINVDVPYDMIPVILEKYEMYSNQGDGKGRVTVRYVDINNDPDAITKYTKNYKGGEITKNSIIISSGDRVKVIDEMGLQGMITPDQVALQNNNYQLLFAGESTITSEIKNVIDKKIIRVAFVDKMNGQTIYRQDDSAYAASIRDKILAKNGYECTDIDIAKDELDTEKYDMVVVPMPQNDFSEDIIKKFSDFLYNNNMYEKNMVYVPCLYNIDPPNITEFLADWCLEIENAVVADPYYTMSSQDPTIISIPTINSEAVGTLPNSSIPFVSPGTRDVKVLKKNNDNIITEVLRTSEGAVNVLELKENSGASTETGVKNAAVISKRERGEQFDVYKSNLLVFGSNMIFADSYIDLPNTYNNANVVVNILNKMTGKEEGTVIPEKSLAHAVIAPTKNEDNGIRIIIIAIPVIMAVIGTAVLLRRKNR